MSDTLAQVLLPVDTPDGVAFRVGTVTGTSPLEVAIAGQAGLSSARVASYTATLNDTVLVLQTKADLIIIGKIVSGG